MDNCMFQIETALLNFSDQSGTAGNGDKTSVVKRLFSILYCRIGPLTQVNFKTLLWKDSPALNGRDGSQGLAIIHTREERPFLSLARQCDTRRGRHLRRAQRIF